MGALAGASDKIGMGAAVLLGLSIPISTAADSVLLGVVLLFWLVGGNYREKLSFFRNPVVMASLVVLASYLVGSLYSTAGLDDILESLSDAKIFLLIPFIMYFFARPVAQRWGIYALVAALCVTLAISYLIWLDLLPRFSLIKGTPQSPTVFKLHITHNIFMAFGAYLFAIRAWHNSSRLRQIIFTGLSMAALFNVLFMAQGRTGYVVLLGLMALFLFQAARWRGLALLLALILLVGAGTWYHKENALYKRIEVSVNELKSMEGPTDIAPDQVIRLNYYWYSLKIIIDNPVLGVGTGGFRQAYSGAVEGTDHEIALHPHNEYLMVGVQLGLFGILCYALLFAVQWRYAYRLEDISDRMLAQGLIVTILSASLVTSTLIDHAEGLFYAWMTALLYAGPALGRRRLGRGA
ncbi:MAG: O-antigen ligase family protein [Syntrophales bacterium]|nr:O-antigen ligase family protein [Syntrophales bacterium]